MVVGSNCVQAVTVLLSAFQFTKCTAMKKRIDMMTRFQDDKVTR